MTAPRTKCVGPSSLAVFLPFSYTFNFLIMKKILLISAQGLGNNILFLPAVRAMREIFPNAKIDFAIGSKPGYEFYKNNPYTDELIYINYRTIRELFPIALKLRKRRYDVSFLSFPSANPGYHLLSFFISAKTRYSHRYPGKTVEFLTFLENRTVEMCSSCHDIQQNLNLIKLIKDKNYSVHLEVFISDAHKKEAEDILRNHGLLDVENLIGIHPGSSSNASFRRWNRFKELIEKIADKNLKCVVFLGPDEVFETDKCVVLKELNIKTLIAVMQHLRIFIGNDSGPMHLAIASGVPHVFGIFGPSDYRRYVNLGDYQRLKVISKNLPCSPCFHTLEKIHGKMKCKFGDWRCLRDIPTDYVWNEVKKYI